MKIMLVAGARPNFMKIAPIISAIDEYNLQSKRIEHILVHTGQHYDNNMSDTFFKDLGLPRPDIYLGVGSASHAVQTAEIMKRFEKVLLEKRPEIVIVVGDVNSTLACALVASKIEYPLATKFHYLRPLIAHVEAGLRSFDRTMPEEINRILTDHLSDFLFVSEPSGIENLKNEGFKNLSSTNQQSLPLVAFVGNTMIDTLLKHRQKAQKSDIFYRLGLTNQPPTTSIQQPASCNEQPETGLEQPAARNGQPATSIQQPATSIQQPAYAVLTLHRPSNVDHKEVFIEILEALKEISQEIPIIFPAHPRTRTRIKQFSLETYFNFLQFEHAGNLHILNKINVVPPLGYIDFLALMSNAKLVLTDSGGIQEETTILGIPCITLRHNTERPITVSEGTNIVVGTDKDKIVQAAIGVLNGKNKGSKIPPLWDGKAAKRIVSILTNSIN